MIISIKGPVYHVLQVEPSQHNYQETIGLPMTILSSAYSEAPDQLSNKTYEFMSSFAPQDEFSRTYSFGNFNSVKWAYDFNEERIRTQAPSPLHLLSMSWDTFQQNTLLSLMSVIELTDMVWEPLTDEVNPISIWREPSQMVFTTSELVSPSFSKIQGLCQEIKALINLK